MQIFKLTKSHGASVRRSARYFSTYAKAIDYAHEDWADSKLDWQKLGNRLRAERAGQIYVIEPLVVM